MGFFGKVECHNLDNRLCKPPSHNAFYFLICYHIYYTDVKAMDQSRVKNSTNLVFILREQFEDHFISIRIL